MTRRLAAALLLASAAAASIAAQQPQVFRSATAVVTVNVAVRRGNRPVSGLTAADFTVTDSGVRQEIVQVSVERVAIPIDMTLIVDVSGSTRDVVDRIRQDAETILGMLRPIDRGRLLAIDTYVHELQPLQSVGPGAALPSQPASGGDSSIYDAIIAALIVPVEPDRRRLVVVFTDGGDTLSVTDPAMLHDVARHTDSVLHIVQTGVAAGVPFAFRSPVLLQVRPVATRQSAMRVAAELTGGAFYESGKTGKPADSVRAFRSVFDEFRDSYVLQYTPEHVAVVGWHEITVKVKGVDDTGVRARKGYFLDAVPSTVPGDSRVGGAAGRVPQDQRKN